MPVYLVRKEPYGADIVKRLMRETIASGSVMFSPHANRELAVDGLTLEDALNTIKGGAVQPGEWENGSWRYQVRTRRLCVVVAFAPGRLVVVTAWREKPK